MADGMLPEELAPWSDEWYTLCERAPHVGEIGISGELAEAIVNCVSRLTRHGAGDAEDAARWRWLASHAERIDYTVPYDDRVKKWESVVDDIGHDHTLDTAIDAARAGERG